MKRNSGKIRRRRVAGLLGAAAAGISGGQAAEAAVVAQSVSAIVPPTYDVDLNGDMMTMPDPENPEEVIVTGREFQISDYTDNDPPVEYTIKAHDFDDGVLLAVDGDFAANLAAGTLIDSSLSFAEPANDDLNGTHEGVHSGNFQVEDGPGFIGVQFLIEGATHYGYVGFEGVELDGTNNGPEGRVFGFGYESTPNTPIAAGDGLPAEADADFDGDGDVDGDDFLTWQRGLGLAGQTDNANGDADANGTVEGADLDAWKAAFNGGPSGPATAIPEPASLALLAAGATGIAAYRRRTR